MAHANRVLRSINDEGAARCVDLFVRPGRDRSASKNIGGMSKTAAASCGWRSCHRRSPRGGRCARGGVRELPGCGQAVRARIAGPAARRAEACTITRG